MRRHLLPLLLAVLAAPATAGPSRATLTVAAAANLKLAAEELKRSFEAEHPEVVVALTFGASGVFFAQLQHGAPFDVFLSADRDYPDKVVAAGLADAADEKVYALGELVVWLAPGARVDVGGKGLAALAHPSVRRIALANPAVAPFGRAAEAALRSAGVLDAVRGRLVLGTSAGQVAQFATTGAVEAAFLPRSLTLAKELAAGKVVAIPPALHPPIEQAGVVLAGAKEPALARAFLTFVAGAPGRAILARYGYGPPDGGAPAGRP